MSEFRFRCRQFGRGLYCGGRGALVGLAVFFATYFIVFDAHAPLTAHVWFSAGSVVPDIVSLVSVTTYAILGRRKVGISRIVFCSFLGVLIARLFTPVTSMSPSTRIARLRENPLFELEFVWQIFAVNVVAIAVSYVFAPWHIEQLSTTESEEKLTR